MPELPEGFFWRGDILAYRAMVAQVPNGGRIAELGCYKGRSLCSIADLIVSKNLTVEAVDTWHYASDAMDEFSRNVEAFGLKRYLRYSPMRSVDAAKSMPGNLDLVFIDTPHDYDSVIADLRAWLPKVKPGGIIAGHDYCGKWPGVARALHEMFGDLDFSANVDEESYCVCWMKRVGLNAAPANAIPSVLCLNEPMANVMYTNSGDAPTCRDCGKISSDVKLAPDPYAHEINDDSTPVWMCSDCRYNSSHEI